MPAGRNYTLGENRIRQGAVKGFACRKDGTLCCEPKRESRTFFVKPVDGMIQGSRWGRLSFVCSLEEGMTCYVHAFASDAEELAREEQTKELFWRMQAERFLNQDDILLYQLQGRFLFLLFEVTGKGKGSIGRIRLDLTGDHFMNTFPQVYREHNSFLHRFLSVFSSLYKDFGEEIDNAAKLIDPQTAPAEWLPMLGAWMGLDLSGNFLEEKRLRLLVCEAFLLNGRKGTKWALERLTEIVLGERARILERSAMEAHIPPGERKTYGRLYGESLWDVTILVQKQMPEKVRAQLLFLLEQFKPVRSRLRIVWLEESSVLDSYGYLDVNVRTAALTRARLDWNMTIGTGFVRL